MSRTRTLVVALALAACNEHAPPPLAAGASAQAATRRALPLAAVAPTAASTAALAPPRQQSGASAAARPQPVIPPRRPRPPLAPDLVLLINGQHHNPVIVAGWPVVVRLELASPDGKPWRLSGGAEPWSRLVQLKFTSGAMWPLEPVGEAPQEVTLDDTTQASLVWTLSAEKSATLTPGVRTLDAILDATGAPAGTWQGTRRARTERVLVIAAPDKLPEGWSARKAEIEVEHAFWREGAAAALGRVDKALAAERSNWRLLLCRCQLLVRLGRAVEALPSVDEALRSWTREHPGGCLPDDLLAMRAEVLRAALRK